MAQLGGKTMTQSLLDEEHVDEEEDDWEVEQKKQLITMINKYSSNTFSKNDLIILIGKTNLITII